MSESIRYAASARAKEIRSRVRRRRLVFVQCGAVFDCLREGIVDELGGTAMSASGFIQSATDAIEANGILILTDLEEFARTDQRTGPSLGQLRERVDAQLDLGTDVCLLSRSPRISFPTVPGSSVIEDASIYTLPLLTPAECPSASPPTDVERILPEHSLGNASDLTKLFELVLRELGVETLAALDHSIFEAKLGQNFIQALGPQETEALRGAGLIANFHGTSAFAIPKRFTEFSSAVGHALSKLVAPQPELQTVMSGLWIVERTLRRALRDTAVDKHAGRWRRNVLVGDLPSKVLERAQADAYVTAESISDIRDPIEWLSLGELLQIIRSTSFDGLSVDDRIWTRMVQELLPIRNRLSHMRLIKKGDSEIVSAWVAHIQRLIK